MKRHFYSHVIHLHDVYTELDELDLHHQEKEHLVMLIDSTVHHTVIDVVLTELHEDDKEKFIQHLHKDEHEELWRFLKMSVFDIEHKLINSIESVKKDLIKEIRKTKK